MIRRARRGGGVLPFRRACEAREGVAASEGVAQALATTWGGSGADREDVGEGGGTTTSSDRGAASEDLGAGHFL